MLSGMVNANLCKYMQYADLFCDPRRTDSDIRVVLETRQVLRSVWKI